MDELPSIQAAERFLELAGVPRRVPKDVLAFLGSEAMSCRNMDPWNPNPAQVTHALSHVFPGGSSERNQWKMVAYLHYLLMRAYAEAHPLATWTHPMPSDKEDSAAIARDGVQRLPPWQLREILWVSLSSWREQYPGQLVGAISQFLITVHIDHSVRYQTVFRSEFLIACVWTGTADWAAENMPIYEAANECGREAISAVVENAARTGESSIDVLRREGDYTLADGTPSEWHRIDWTDVRTTRDFDVTDLGDPFFLDEQAKQRLDESLRRIFGAQGGGSHA